MLRVSPLLLGVLRWLLALRNVLLLLLLLLGRMLPSVVLRWMMLLLGGILLHSRLLDRLRRWENVG